MTVFRAILTFKQCPSFLPGVSLCTDYKTGGRKQIKKYIVTRNLLFSKTDRFRVPFSFNEKMCRSKCDLVIYMRSSFAFASDNCTRPLLPSIDASSIGIFGLLYVIIVQHTITNSTSLVVLQNVHLVLLLGNEHF